MRHAFICYVHDNTTDVRRLASDLRAAGAKVWLDHDDIRPGTFWKKAIKEAIRDGAFFIACFSRELNARGETFANAELRFAIDRLRTMPQNKIWFIPVFLNETYIPSFDISDYEKLEDIQSIKLFEDWKVGVNKILKIMDLEFMSISITLRKDFFDPDNDYSSSLIYRPDYVTPHQTSHGSTPSSSSTDAFRNWMGSTFDRLHDLKACQRLSHKRIMPSNAHELFDDLMAPEKKENVISYASSKINPMTDRIMSDLEKAYGHILHFVLEADLDRDRLRSEFDPSRQDTTKESCALMYGNTPFRKADKGIDYGVIIRAKARPNTSNLSFWWVVAGCGRIASIAAQELLVNPFGCEQLASELIKRSSCWEDFNLIALIFKVKYNPKKDFIMPEYADTGASTRWNIGIDMQPGFVDVLMKE